MTLKLFGVVNDDQTERAAIQVLRSGQLAAGPHVEAFRVALGAVIGNYQVVTTNDMSSAMTIALRLAGVGPGDEVIAPPYSCLSSNAPIGTSGAQIVWSDMDPATGTTTPKDIADRIGPRTRAVVLYHTAGHPAPAAAVAALCRDAGVVLIEDCNNALGATIDGRPVGSFGDLAVYSFYPNRQINAIDGGAVACRSPDHFRRAGLLRRYGIDSTVFRDARGEIDPAVDVAELGWAATLNNLHSGFALAQMDTLGDRLAATRRNAELLRGMLADVPGLTAVEVPAGSVPAYWTVLALAEHRDALLAAMKAAGVDVSIMHQRNDVYTGFGTASVDLPGVARFNDHVIALPCGWWLEPDDVRRIGEVAAELSLSSA